jgi:hypothetical protein
MANYKVTLWFPINRCTFHILFSYLLSIGWTSWWIVPTNYAEYNLLRWDMGNTNQEQASTEGEGLSPTLESLVILTSLRFIHIESPKLVNRRYGTELRSHTLDSIKPKISETLESLLEESRCLVYMFLNWIQNTFTYMKVNWEYQHIVP